MSTNWELQLLSSILHSPTAKDDFVDVLESGVEAAIFQGAEAKALWSRMYFHYNRPDRFGKMPGLTLVKEWFPSIHLPTASEDIDELVDLVKQGYLLRETEAAIGKYLKTRDENPRSSLTDLSVTIAALQERVSISKDVSFKEVGVDQTVEELTAIRENDGLVGIPYPWEPLNKMTGGINRGDYIMIYALPKSMKTWIGLYIAVCLAQTGRKVLVYSKEMTWEKMRARIACILTKTDYSAYKSAELAESELERVVQGLIDFVEDENTGDIIFTDVIRPDGKPGGPDEVRHKMDVYKPDIVLLDSAYMLEMPDQHTNPYDWKSLAVVNRRLKQTFKTTGIPGIAIFQENERAAFKYKGTRGTASMAMNTSAINDCDIAIRGVYHKSKRMISLHLPAARETEQEGFTINAIAACDFSFATMELWDIGEFDEEDSDTRPPSGGHVDEATNRVQSFVGSQIDDWRTG